ncbi:MAG TPA: hypothetical protein VF168_05450 [Trueperaceae bacterium]
MWWVLGRERDHAYALVALWAVVAILVANLGTPLLAVLAAAAALIVGVALLAPGRPRGPGESA